MDEATPNESRDSLYALLAEPSGAGPREETALTASKETLDADSAERDRWLIAFGG